MPAWDITALLAGLNAIAAAMLPLLGAVAALMGLFFIGKAVFGLFPSDRNADIRPGLLVMQALVGAMLLRASGTVQWAREIVGGTGSGLRSYLTISGPASSGILQQIVSVGMLWVAVIGFLGVIRGLALWREAAMGDARSSGKDPFWAGLWHILGGAIAVNIGTG